MNIFQKGLSGLIRFYQENISPLKEPSCIYYPSCSQYGLQAVEKHGAFKGGLMATARVLRCHPFHEGGVDRVPEHFTLKRNPDDLDKIYFHGLGVFSEEELENADSTHHNETKK